VSYLSAHPADSRNQGGGMDADDWGTFRIQGALQMPCSH